MENDPIEELLLRAYPNPERKGCPGSETIHALANKAIPHDDSAWQHIWTCSPCFAEFKELRDARLLRDRATRRKRNLYWATAAAVILLCVGAALAAFFLRRSKAQQPPIAKVTSPKAAYPAAILNLEGVSTTRSGEKSTTGGQVQIQTLPRRAVDLTVYLPRGSEDGDYQLEFLNSRDNVFISTKAQASVTRGLTQFSVPVDLTKVSPGTYTVRSRRLPDGMWRVSGVTVQ